MGKKKPIDLSHKPEEIVVAEEKPKPDSAAKEDLTKDPTWILRGNALQHIAASRRAPVIRLDRPCITARNSVHNNGEMMCEFCKKCYPYAEMKKHYTYHSQFFQDSDPTCSQCRNKFHSEALLAEHVAL